MESNVCKVTRWPLCPWCLLPSRSSLSYRLSRGTKDPSPDIRKEVTNGISKDPETVAERKNCSSPQKSGSTNSHLKSPQQPKLKPCDDSPRKVLQSSVLQKTSSTIVLQASKVQPEVRAAGIGASCLGEEKKGLSAPQQAISSTRQCGLGGSVGNKFVMGNLPIENQRESTFPKFESQPQSQEVTEDQTVKFICEGE